MKKYQISNPERFYGEVEVVYNEGVLVSIDFSKTDLRAPGITAFKTGLPALESFLSTSFSKQTSIASADFDISFETFWLKYDYKFNKKRAEVLWEGLSKTSRVLAFYGTDKYARFLSKFPGRAKLYPDTYLRNKAWENDYK